MLIHAPDDVTAVGAMMFATGLLLNLGYSSFSVYAMGLTTRSAFPVAAALVNTAGQVGGALAPFLTGLILDAYSWSSVFAFMAACATGALVLVLSIADPRPRSEHAP